MLILTPETETRSAVIWLHGLGADGGDFLPLARELELAETLGVCFLFPNAPQMPVTMNGGMVMPAWYDIYSLEPGAPIDDAGILASARRILALVDNLKKGGLESERVVLAGFSQGGLVALAAALHDDRPLAGVMALSTYLPAQLVPEHAVPRSIFQAHGSHDPVVPLSVGKAARNHLLSLGHEVEWHKYAMDHTVCEKEAADIRNWLLKVLA